MKIANLSNISPSFLLSLISFFSLLILDFFFKGNRIENYFLLNSLPKHPLEAEGYLSIGCTNCTIKTKNIKNIRDGRWSDNNKTECGIHLEQKDRDG